MFTICFLEMFMRTFRRPSDYSLVATSELPIKDQKET